MGCGVIELKYAMPMKWIRTLIIIATLMTAACTTENCPQNVLKQFYSQYLELCCPPNGEYPDFNKAQQLLQQYMTPQLYDKWMKSHDAESSSWIDYDMFVQGQDCWPGIRAESISRIGKSQWYEVVVVLPDYDNLDSIVKRSSVFFHLSQQDEAWHIDAVDDGFNHIGCDNTIKDMTLLNSPEYQKQRVLTNLIVE